MTLTELIEAAETSQKTSPYHEGEAVSGRFKIRVVSVSRKKPGGPDISVLFYLDGQRVKRHELVAAMGDTK